MKALATATVVIIVLAVAVMATVGFMFIRGFNPGTSQISREQAVAKCQSLCAQDQQKIYQLSGHPGVLDLPNEKDGVSFLKPTSFCSHKFNVKGYGDVYCDKLTSCKVTDGDGDVGYLHCTGGLKIVNGGGSGGSVGGGSGGGSVAGPVAVSVAPGEHVMSCDKDSGEYIKLYTNNKNPIAESKLRIWGIVCEGSSPVINQEVYMLWNDNPLSRVVYSQNFDNITNDNKHNLQVLRGWNISDVYFVVDSKSHCGNTLEKCRQWFWNNIGEAGVIDSLGYLSPYRLVMTKHESGYPMPMTMKNYFNVPINAQNGDEVDTRISASAGPRFYYKNGQPYLTLAGTVTEIVFELSNGTNTKYVHYVEKYSGCHPGSVWDCYLTKPINSITSENCSNLLKNGYEKIGMFQDVNWNNEFTYRNVTYPGNSTNNIYIFKHYSKWWSISRFPFRSDVKVGHNYKLDRIYFLQYSLGIGGCGGAGIILDNFKIISYTNTTKTNQLGMFNTTIQVPIKTGTYTLEAHCLQANGQGTINVNAIPNIKINYNITKNTTDVIISGNITYLDGTPVKDSPLWILINGNPYPGRITVKEYNFSNPNDINYFKVTRAGPNLIYYESITNGVLNVSSYDWWGGAFGMYYVLNNPSYITNVSYDILLKVPKHRLYNPQHPHMYDSMNYSYAVSAYVVNYGKYQGDTYKYLSENGTNLRGRPWWIKVPALTQNLTLGHWYHITYNPMQWVGGANNGNRRIYLLGWHAWSPDHHQLGILLDNVTIKSVGQMYTNSTGGFKLVIPIGGSPTEIPEGNDKIEIIAYDKLGAKAEVTKTIMV